MKHLYSQDKNIPNQLQALEWLQKNTNNKSFNNAQIFECIDGNTKQTIYWFNNHDIFMIHSTYEQKCDIYLLSKEESLDFVKKGIFLIYPLDNFEVKTNTSYEAIIMYEKDAADPAGETAAEWLKTNNIDNPSTINYQSHDNNITNLILHQNQCLVTTEWDCVFEIIEKMSLKDAAQVITDRILMSIH